MIIDLDQDGDLEIILGAAGALVSIDIMENGSLGYYGGAYWSQDRGDNRKTGYYEVSDIECNFPMLGDLNCDGYSDILDILSIVTAIINSQDLSVYQNWASDMNDDGIIDVLDIMVIVNSIVN